MRRYTCYFFVVLLLVYLTWMCAGCGLHPIRIFQAKVPTPVVKAEKQLESERQAADVLVRGIAGVKRIEELTTWLEVARKLSIALGPPQKPIALDPSKPEVAAEHVISGLEAGMADLQKKITAQNAILAKYAGKEIEGTGFSLLGPGMTVVVIGLIALAVLCPPALTLMMFAYRRLKSTAGMVVEQIEQAAVAPETKAAVTKIKANLGNMMDHLPVKEGALHRAVIKDLKTA